METTDPPRVSMRGIVKRFDGVVALAGVDFAIVPGEVHAIVGENGAGKSTLIKILTGVHTADEGVITVEGTERNFRRPTDALAAGIATIHQEIHLVPTMSAVENVFLGREPKRRFGLIDRPAMRRATVDLLSTYRVPVSPDVPIGELGVAAQQMIAIIRALSLGGRVLVMDEPTSALTHNEVEALLQIVRRLRAEGVAIVYISHRLDEIFDVGDRVTVLRDGLRVRTDPIAAIDRRSLVESMLGRPAAAVRPSRVRGEGAVGAPLVATNLTAEPRIHAASATIGRGEIVGLAGLQGSGRTEFMRLVFGADRASSGTVDLGAGGRLPTSPADSLGLGLAYLPEDRKADGIIPDLSVRENLSLVVLPALARLGIVRPGAERELVETFIARLGIRCASQDIPIRSLSGGNQQKVLIARLLCSAPAFLLLDDPMRGIDVGAKAEIARLIAALADGGLGVLMTSSELEEVTSAADRVVVMRDGRTTGEYSGNEVRFETIAAAIAGERRTGPEIP